MRREHLHLLGKEIAVKAASTQEAGNRLLVAASLFIPSSTEHHQGILTHLYEHTAYRSKFVHTLQINILLFILHTKYKYQQQQNAIHETAQECMKLSFLHKT